MPEAPTIRLAEEADLSAIVTITNVAIRVGHAHFATQPWGTDDAGAAFRQRDRRHPWLVAVLDGEVVGYCKAGHWKDRGAYDWTVDVGVYMDERARGRGLGRRLYERLIPELERGGIRTVVAGIALPNWPSVALHEALGFKQTGVLPRVGYKDGWRDVGYWVLHLGGDGPPG